MLIYMPMIPEAIVAMLACARIGAIHSLVFGGFAAKELGARIAHAEVGFGSVQTFHFMVLFGLAPDYGMCSDFYM